MILTMFISNSNFQMFISQTKENPCGTGSRLSAAPTAEVPKMKLVYDLYTICFMPTLPSQGPVCRIKNDRFSR
ncbi:protein of unknown function [Ruminococcaceae bacterium BL-6]|nr:protein of unknown function [Ruminococcaceae bacterium BL-6]